MIYITKLTPYQSGGRTWEYAFMTADNQRELNEMAEILGFTIGNNRYVLDASSWELMQRMGAKITV